ncbi:MAG: hypothetical protein HFJ06_00280 [Lachnospiraceae bacterium]|nr:hypothetical protein [Lachnospiraceae bacterium]
MWRKIISSILVGMMLIACTGCSNSDISSNSTGSEIDSAKETIKVIAPEDAKNTDVIKIGDEVIKLDYVYLYVIQFLYTFKMADGSSVKDNMSTYKEQIISQLRTDEIQYQYAKKNGIELTEKEKEEMDAVVDKYYKTFSEEFLEGYGISRDTVTDLFYKQRYLTILNDNATKELQEELTQEAEKDLKDKEFFELYYLLFPTVEYGEDGKAVVDSAGNNVKLSSEKLEEQKALAEDARKRLMDGEDAEKLAEEYKIKDYSDTLRAYKGAYSEELNNLIQDMKEGDISEVYEDDLGYMVVKMIKTNDEEYKQYYIEASVSQKVQQQLSEKKNEWLQTVEVDMENDMVGAIWKNLDISKIAKKMEKENLIQDSSK